MAEKPIEMRLGRNRGRRSGFIGRRSRNGGPTVLVTTSVFRKAIAFAEFQHNRLSGVLAFLALLENRKVQMRNRVLGPDIPDGPDLAPALDDGTARKVDMALQVGVHREVAIGMLQE